MTLKWPWRSSARPSASVVATVTSNICPWSSASSPSMVRRSSSLPSMRRIRGPCAPVAPAFSLWRRSPRSTGFAAGAASVAATSGCPDSGTATTDDSFTPYTLHSPRIAVMFADHPHLRRCAGRGFKLRIEPHDPRGDVIRLQRVTDEIALGEVAAELREELPALGLVDALRDDLETHAVAEVDRRFDDDRVVRVGLQIEHERLVDLDLIDRQALQLHERSKARAEV